MPNTAQRESNLLLKIHQGLPPDLAQRYHELMARRRARVLAPGEHEELLRLTDQVEGLEGERRLT